MFVALRPTQWVKNFIIFTPVIFSGQLFDPYSIGHVLVGFISFCFVSSAAYLVNDLRDRPYDQKHPLKRLRPIAAGTVSDIVAKSTVVLLLAASIILGMSLSLSFLFIVLAFFILNMFYTFYLKQFAVFDILMIAFFFTLRGFAGEIITGYHVPVWLVLTIIFLSLFIASAKRHSELLRMGKETRPALNAYRERLLDFYATTFGSATVLSYSLFVYYADPPVFNNHVREFLSFVFPLGLERKWLILTVPFVLVGVMRYAQIVYENRGGEAPEQVITTDKPLLISIVGWVSMIIFILYLV